MDCGEVNAVSFSNALTYLQNEYLLNHRIGFIQRKVKDRSVVTDEEMTAYLEELDFDVQVVDTEILDTQKLNKYELLFCFDEQNDIIVLRHDTDFDRHIAYYRLKKTAFILNSKKLKPRHHMEVDEPKSIRWFMKQLFARDALSIILTGIVTNLLMYVVPIYNMNVFDKVLPNGFAGILLSLVLIAVLLCVIWFINRSALSYLLSDKIFRLDIKLTDNFTRRLCHLKPSYLPQSAGFLSQTITYGKSLSQLLGLLQLLAAVDFPFLIMAIVLVGILGGELVAIPLVAIILVISINLFLQPRIKRYISEQYQFEASKRRFEYEVMQSLPFIKLGGMETYFTDHFKHNRPDHHRYYSIAAHVNHVSTLILFISLIAVTGYGAWLVSAGVLTIGQLVACSLLTSKAVTNAKITNMVFNINRIRILFKNLNQFYQIPVEDKPDAFCLSHIRHMSLNKIEYQYPKNPHFNLNNLDISLTVPEKLFIYGQPGAGKTTLFRLLAGLLDCSSGHMLINNLNVSHFDYRNIRRHIHFSSSYYRFFPGTLYNNLSLGRKDISAANITKALERVKLTEKINQIEDGLHFQVENVDNIPLSSSERKRFMLARIFLTEADLIILDEPFDFLSDENSYHLLQQVTTFCNETKKGLIVLSNRKSFMQFFDRSLMLNKGKLYPIKSTM
ncbi:Leukotoxin export ATP-binding protein LtxB [invertebrate metagenome]|uniref:Leukotoxin export ATP-binding protein LtxB n=1 Tax=invertebrate metagenome TaxID=1711999 RepID=A0A2H9T647_9ZZZZ